MIFSRLKAARAGVPIETKAIRDLLSCEFNGPFEEFALVEELRHSRRGAEGLSHQADQFLFYTVQFRKFSESSRNSV